MAARQYPLGSSEYKILEEIGQGVSAVVYRALCIPFNEVVAVKSLDLERCNSNLDDIRREAQTMSLINHPNVVKSYCSFVVDCNLWVVMPYMAGGSCLHIMKAAYPDGFEETIIATFLKESLKALEYLHRHGHIHRDVKAGNILVAANGGVKLADFGVSACMFDMGDRQRSRNTFVGTPCWMAPEVMEQLHGYDFKADIWSLGITALELAHGHAPFSKYPPMKVLLMTLQNAPPGLDYERDKRFSKSFKEMIAMCLVKDPTKRPTAEKLLKHSFFKHAKSPDYVLRRVLDGLPPLWERVKTLKIKEAARLAQKKMPYEQQEELSQSEYKRGVSAWNFDLEDLKAQASLIQDDDGMSGEMQSVPNSPCTHEANGIGSEDGSCTDLYTANGSPYLESAEVEEEVDSVTKSPLGQENLVGQKSDDREKYEWDQRRTNSNQHAGRQWSSSPLVPERVIDGERNRLSSRAGEDLTRVRDRASSGPLTSNGSMLECRMANGSSVLARSSLGNTDGGEDESNGVVQRKGRFSVFSAGVGQKEDVVAVLNARKPVASPIHKSASVGDWSQEKKPTVPSPLPLSTLAATTSALQVPAAILLPQLQNLLSQTKAQKDVLMNIMASISTGDYSAGFTSIAQRTSQNNSRNYSRSSSSNSDNSPDTWSERERDFMQQVVDLKGRVSLLVDELQATKLRNVQLERQLNAIYNKEEEERIRREEAEREDG